MLNKNLLMAVTLAATAATTTVTAQSNERTDCDICAFPIKPDEDTPAPGLSAACEASDERILAIIASDSACGRSWDAFCIVKYNDCYNDACGVSQQDLVDSIALTGGPGTPPRPLNRDQVLSSCDAPLPTPRPTVPATPPPSQSAATILPTPCIPEVYGDCVEDCEEEFGLSVSDCIEYCANGGGGQYGGKGGKGGKGGSVCGAKGGKGGKGGNKGGKGGKGGDGYGGKGGKGGDGYGGKGGKGGKSGYYEDDCCVLAGYGGKGSKGFFAYGGKGGKGGDYYGEYGGKGGKGYGGAGRATPKKGAAFGAAVNNFIENQNGNVVQANADAEAFFFQSF